MTEVVERQVVVWRTPLVLRAVSWLVVGALGGGAVMYTYGVHKVGAAAKSNGTVQVEGIPNRYATAYVNAAATVGAACGLRWEDLAAIGWNESHHGAIVGDPPIDAAGYFAWPVKNWDVADYSWTVMQVQGYNLPTYGTDGNGDGKIELRDMQQIDDVMATSANYLCRHGYKEDRRRAIRSYNGSGPAAEAYADRALAVAETYKTGPGAVAVSRSSGSTPRRVAAYWAAAGQRQWSALGDLLRRSRGDKLDQAYSYLDPAVMSVLETLAERSGAQAPFTGGTTGQFALPLPADAVTADMLGGKHHDYPALDIPVPSGTPVHAPESGPAVRIDNAKCGIGVAVSGGDGRRWVLCHLTSTTVKDGDAVRAGQQVGVSGDTGSAIGQPHLHVELHSGGAMWCPQPTLQAWLAGRADDKPVAKLSGCVG